MSNFACSKMLCINATFLLGWNFSRICILFWKNKKLLIFFWCLVTGKDNSAAKLHFITTNSILLIRATLVLKENDFLIFGTDGHVVCSFRWRGSDWVNSKYLKTFHRWVSNREIKHNMKTNSPNESRFRKTTFSPLMPINKGKELLLSDSIKKQISYLIFRRNYMQQGVPLNKLKQMKIMLNSSSRNISQLGKVKHSKNRLDHYHYYHKWGKPRIQLQILVIRLW